VEKEIAEEEAREEAEALEAEEVEFDDEKDKYQENLFFKLN